MGTSLTLDDVILGKPGTRGRAEAQLALLSGRAHVLLTAVAIVHGEAVFTHVDVTRLTMRKLSAAQIARYLDTDRAYDCAGSYKIEEHGISLFERVESADPSRNRRLSADRRHDDATRARRGDSHDANIQVLSVLDRIV